MWTKRQLVIAALEELGVQSYEFDISPEEFMTAVRRMDSMVASWDARGIRIGYLLPASQDSSDPDQDSGIPDRANEAVYLNLAIRLGPSYGKPVSAETKAAARVAYDSLLWAAAQPQEQQLPNTLPRGAGNKPWRTSDRTFFPTPSTDPLSVSQGGDLDIPAE